MQELLDVEKQTEESLEELIQADDKLRDAMLTLPERMERQSELAREKLRIRGEQAGLLAPNAGGTRAAQTARLQGWRARIDEAAGSPGRGLARAAGGEQGVAAFGVAAATYTALITATEKAARGMEVLGNSFTTGAMKADALFAAFVPGGKSILDLRNALSGASDDFRKVEFNFQREQMRSQQRYEVVGATNQAEAEVARYGSRTEALGRVKIPVPAAIDRGTFQGDIAFQEQQRRLPLQDAAERAGADVRATQTETRASRERLTERLAARGTLQQRLAVADRYRREVWAQEGINVKDREGPWDWFGKRDKPGIQKATRGVEQVTSEIAANEVEIQREITRQKELGVKAAQAESAVRKANINLAREDLAILQSKESRLTSQAVRLGGMSAYERQTGLEAARLVKQHGIAALPPQVLAQAERFAPEYVRKEKEKFGQTTEEGRAGLREGFLEKGDLTAVRAEVAKAQTNVRVAISLDEQALAQKIAGIIAASFGKLLESIRVKQDAQEKELRARQQRRTNEAN
jgi:hypothetical protein